MKMKISILAFLLFSSSFSFAQDTNNDASNYFGLENIIIICLLAIIIILVIIIGRKSTFLVKKSPEKVENNEKSKNSFNKNTIHQDRSQEYKRKIKHLEQELEGLKRRMASENKAKTDLETLISNLKTEKSEILANQIIEQNRSQEHTGKIAELEKELEDCQKRITPESNANLDLETITSEQKPDDIEIVKIESTKSIYFRQPTNDGNFNNDLRIENFEPSISMFKLTLISEKKANFEFCGDKMMSKLISNNPNTHLRLVCDFINTSDSFNSIIENQSKGEVELRSDIWVVTLKAKIKFS
jgi:uncharacterized membrane protein